MRRILLSLALLGSSILTSVASQQTTPLRIGAHIAGNTANGPFDLIRVGGHALIPLGKRLDAYPGVGRFLDEAEWEVSVALRYRPLPSVDNASPWYIGAGWAAINFGPNHTYYDVLLTGMEVPFGRFRPYVEVQALDLVNRLISSEANFAIQVHSGLTWAIR